MFVIFDLWQQSPPQFLFGLQDKFHRPDVLEICAVSPSRRNMCLCLSPTALHHQLVTDSVNSCTISTAPELPIPARCALHSERHHPWIPGWWCVGHWEAKDSTPKWPKAGKKKTCASLVGSISRGPSNKNSRCRQFDTVLMFPSPMYVPL